MFRLLPFLVLRVITTMFYLLMTLLIFNGHFLFHINLKFYPFLLNFIVTLLQNFNDTLKVCNVTMVRNLLIVIYKKFVTQMRFISVYLVHILLLKIKKFSVKFVSLIILFVLFLLMPPYLSLFDHMLFK